MGYVKTAMLLAGLTALFGAVGFLIGGQGGLIIALLVAGGMNIFAYWNSDKLALRMHGAHEVGPAQAPELVGLVRQLADRAGLPMPRVYVIEQDQPNAFATGRNPQNAAVAVTTGLMRALTVEQLAGVIAHELAHIRNRDTLIMTVTATLAGAISLLANFALFFGGANSRNNPLGLIGVLLMMILAPLAAMLVQMAISRSREYEADRIGAEICGRPGWLADALVRIQELAPRIVNRRAEANPQSAHLFIINPLNGQNMDNLFSTHPATANRVQRLRAMAGGAGPSAGARNPWA